jgi:fumarate reductase flavoprotein subunit
LGVHLELVDEVGDPGHTRRRLHAPPSRSGRQLIAELVRLVERRGVRLRLSSPVLHLWTDGSGAAIGARIKVPRKSPANVRCGTLVLASDGFGANVELVRQHCPPAAGLPHAGHAGSTGDGIGWADDIGAATRDLGAFDAHASVAVGSNQLLPWELITHGAILVNQGGRRFADETRGPAALVTPLSAQPGRIAYEVLDARILKCLADRHPYFASEVAPRVLRRADEVEVLARQFQIDPGALAQTVAAYNAAVATGMDALGRTAFEAPLAPPFYAARVSAALLQTLGGLVIDTSARVLRRDGTPIPNLYAGGGAAAGVSGPGGDGYLLGMGLLGALGWGRIAGEHARNEILAARAATQVSPAPPPASEPDGPAA